MTRLRHATTPFLAIALIGASLVLAGCGSSGSKSSKSSSKSSSATTKTTKTATGGGTDTTSSTSTTGSGGSVSATSGTGGGWLATCGKHGDGSKQQYDAPPKQEVDAGKTYTATLVTSEGTLTAELLPKVAPITVNNFVFLACQGFYTNIKVHRIVPGFMMQTGDPQGTGAGGPGYSIEDEPVKQPYTRGILAMANAGPNTGGSQFFIMFTNYELPPNYTIFGKVTGNDAALSKIEKVPVGDNGQGETSKPQRDVVLKSVSITHT